MIKLNGELYRRNKEGAHSFISAFIPDYYRPNKNLALKVFKEEWQPKKEFKWKTVSLYDATIIQNIFWNHGVAPRVYDLITIEVNGEKKWAQIVDYVEEDKRGILHKDTANEITRVMKEFGILRQSIDGNPHHQYKDCIVDFSHYYFKDDLCRHKIIDLVETDAGWGSNPATYQSVQELGVSGQRDLTTRLKVYGFDEIDFKGKTVLDYGCSSGQVMRECMDRGAAFAVGLELPKVANAARHLNNYMGYFNMDFYGGNFRHDHDVYSKIKNLTGIDKFDIVLYLSCQQLLMPDYLKDIVGELFILEGHVPDKEETYRPRLEQDFKQVEFKGASVDHGIRPVFVCRN